MKTFLGILLLMLAFSVQADWKLSTHNKLETLPGGAELVEYEVQQNGKMVRVHAVYFHPKQIRLAVVDNPNRILLGESMKAIGALAGVNGGYFHADWQPVGLEIADRVKIHSFEKAKLLSGVLVVTKNEPRIVRSNAYVPMKTDTNALQAGPFLVENSKVVSGLNDQRIARRTVIATDGKGKWALLLFTPLTLADAAKILTSTTGFPDFQVEKALNLDGGSSSAFWVARKAKTFYLSELGRVRNFIALLPL